VVGKGWGAKAKRRVAGPMADVHKLSKQVAGAAERLADVADAARGQRSRRRGAIRWVLLPAAGAVAYAAAKSGLKGSARAKDGAREAKERAPLLPDLDLLGRVKEVVGQPDSEQLERNRQDRAKRRQRRRASTSA
jgi:hypothetical protein